MSSPVRSGSGEMAAPGLTIPAAATHLGVSPTTVYRLVRRGELPHTRVGGCLRIAAADLEAYLTHGRSATWRRVDRRGRPRRPDPEGHLMPEVLDRQAALTKRYRWAVLAGDRSLDVGESDEYAVALAGLEARMRDFVDRAGVAGRFTFVMASGFQLSIVLPLSYFDARRFLETEAGRELAQHVEIVLAPARRDAAAS